jgi:integrase
MSLFKRGGIWWLRFTAPDGREIRQTTRTADKRQAQELHDRRKAELWRQIQLGERPRRTWQDAVVRWLEEHQDRKKLAEVKAIFRQIDPILGPLALDQITPDTLAMVTAYLRPGLKPLSVNSKLSKIRAVLNAACRWEWIAKAPRVILLPVTDRRTRFLTREEADRLLRELPAHVAAMARLSLATGLREHNICGLEWAQIDFERRVLWIHADQSKTRRLITIPLNTDAVVILRGQHGQHPRWVFTWRDKPLSRANRRGWQAALRRAGLTGVRWHDLRHTWASWHVQAGTPLAVLKELGGWASLDMVLRYAHLAPGHLAEHAERISGPRLIHTNPDTPSDQQAASG